MSRRTNTIRRNKAAKRKRQRRRDFLAALRHVEQHRTPPHHFGQTITTFLFVKGFVTHTGHAREFALTEKGKRELYQPR